MNKPVHPDLETDKIELGELKYSLGFLLRIAQVKVFNAFYDRLAQYNLRPGEFTVLWVIGKNPGLKQGTVARRLSIKPAHMTKLIGRMEKDGYVSRDVPADDRRALRLSLTKAGRDFVDAHKAEFLQFHEEERSALTAEEQQHLTELLLKFGGFEDKP